MNLFNKCWGSLLIFCFHSNVRAQHNTLFIDSVHYSCATNFSVSVKTKNLKNIVGIQGSINWDTTIVKYSSINYGNSGILFNTSNMNLNQVSNGHLSYIWYDAALTGQSSPDNSILFTIQFNRNGIGKGTASIDFSSTPTQLEIDTLRTDGVPVKDQEAIFTGGVIETPYLYTFIGTGNWDNPLNWKNNIIPPTTLPECSEIIITPINNTECILNRKQTISNGGKLTITNNKKFRIPQELSIQ